MTMHVEVDHLTLRYGNITAVDDLSFALQGDRIYGLLGRNGSGKTSLLSVLAAFRPPTEGTPLVGGQPVFENQAFAEQVCLIRETGDTGYVPAGRFHSLDQSQPNRISRMNKDNGDLSGCGLCDPRCSGTRSEDDLNFSADQFRGRRFQCGPVYFGVLELQEDGLSRLVAQKF
jgi:energy-coupling factor transporter ATP-binding protein EcfA2